MAHFSRQQRPTSSARSALALLNARCASAEQIENSLLALPVSWRALVVGIASLGVDKIRPEHALSMFEFDYPTSSDAKQLVDYLMIVYGVRDIFIGVALLSAASSGNRTVLGWNLLAFAGAAFADGLVCKMNGHGEWNHWGYGSVVGILGVLSTGGF